MAPTNHRIGLAPVIKTQSRSACTFPLGVRAAHFSRTARSGVPGVDPRRARAAVWSPSRGVIGDVFIRQAPTHGRVAPGDAKDVGRSLGGRLEAA